MLYKSKLKVGDGVYVDAFSTVTLGIIDEISSSSNTNGDILFFIWIRIPYRNYELYYVSDETPVFDTASSCAVHYASRCRITPNPVSSEPLVPVNYSSPVPSFEIKSIHSGEIEKLNERIAKLEQDSGANELGLEEAGEYLRRLDRTMDENFQALEVKLSTKIFRGDNDLNERVDALKDALACLRLDMDGHIEIHMKPGCKEWMKSLLNEERGGLIETQEKEPSQKPEFRLGDKIFIIFEHSLDTDEFFDSLLYTAKIDNFVNGSIIINNNAVHDPIDCFHTLEEAKAELIKRIEAIEDEE